MKRLVIICIVIILFIFSFQSAAFSQLGFRKGIKVGYNLATLSGDEDVDSRKAFAAGLGIEFNFLSLLSFQVDAIYSPRGASSDGTELKLTYLSIPMVLKKKFFPMGMHPYIMGGPEFSFLLSAKSGDADVKDSLTSEDLAFVLGGGLEFSFIGKSAYAEVRYSYGLNNINKNEESGDAKNRVTQIFFGILF